MDPSLLICHLTKEKDSNNQLILTHDRLIVVYKAKAQVFQRSQIQGIELNRKKLIIPLVIGGIGTSMAIVAMSMGWYDRMLNLITIFTFFGILYYGFIGKDALEIKEKGHSSIFLLTKLSPSILRFKKFFDLSQYNISHIGKDFIFHLVDIKIWEEQLEKENYTAGSLYKEGFIHASNPEQVIETYRRYYANKESMVLLTIVPKYLSSRLEYDWNRVRNEYFPHIYGPVNKTAIVRLQYFSSTSTSTNIEE